MEEGPAGKEGLFCFLFGMSRVASWNSTREELFNQLALVYVESREFYQATYNRLVVNDATFRGEWRRVWDEEVNGYKQLIDCIYRKQLRDLVLKWTLERTGDFHARWSHGLLLFAFEKCDVPTLEQLLSLDGMTVTPRFFFTLWRNVHPRPGQSRPHFALACALALVIFDAPSTVLLGPDDFSGVEWTPPNAEGVITQLRALDEAANEPGTGQRPFTFSVTHHAIARQRVADLLNVVCTTPPVPFSRNLASRLVERILAENALDDIKPGNWGDHNAILNMSLEQAITLFSHSDLRAFVELMRNRSDLFMLGFDNIVDTNRVVVVEFFVRLSEFRIHTPLRLLDCLVDRPVLLKDVLDRLLERRNTTLLFALVQKIGERVRQLETSDDVTMTDAALRVLDAADLVMREMTRRQRLSPYHGNPQELKRHLNEIRRQFMNEVASNGDYVTVLNVIHFLYENDLDNLPSSYCTLSFIRNNFHAANAFMHAHFKGFLVSCIHQYGEERVFDLFVTDLSRLYGVNFVRMVRIGRELADAPRDGKYEPLRQLCERMASDRRLVGLYLDAIVEAGVQWQRADGMFTCMMSKQGSYSWSPTDEDEAIEAMTVRSNGHRDLLSEIVTNIYSDYNVPNAWMSNVSLVLGAFMHLWQAYSPHTRDDHVDLTAHLPVDMEFHYKTRERLDSIVESPILRMSARDVWNVLVKPDNRFGTLAALRARATLQFIDLT